MSGHFTRFAAIDWSGAKGSKHKGIALALCEAGDAAPRLIVPPPGVWSRRAIADWIVAQADEPILIGMDFSFAPPWILRRAYLPGSDAPSDAVMFWRWVDAACNDEDYGAASLLESLHRLHFYFGAADGTKADYMHLRQCELLYNAQGGGKPSSIFDVIGAAQVAKASFAGMRVLHAVNHQVPVWPFDPKPTHGGLIVEIYTTIAARAAGIRKGLSKIRDAATLDTALGVFECRPHIPLDRYDDHATDAILTAAWLRANAKNDELWHPPALTSEIAQTEGWTFGVSARMAPPI